MILIVDSGSTNADWCLVDKSGEKKPFRTEGYNPHFVNESYIISSLGKNLPAYIETDRIEAVYFYGAGCMAGKSIIVKNALSSIFMGAKIEVEVDLLAAARALLGRNIGFVAILGTGTNTCVYDGKNIIQNIDSLGYMLGDEGSGSYIGKKLLQDYLRGYMPKQIHLEFSRSINLSFDEIMDRVYTHPLPNRFCAGFTKFIGENIQVPYLYDLIKSSFVDFFTNLVCHYPSYQNYSFNCLGSIGYYFQDILKEVVNQFNMNTEIIVRSPMDRLIDYHS